MAIDIEVGIIIVMVMVIGKASCSFIFNFIYELKKDIFLSHPPHFFPLIYQNKKKSILFYFFVELVRIFIQNKDNYIYILYY